MTRWHTDRPVPPIAPLGAVPPMAAVTLLCSTASARAGLRRARAHWRRKLRAWGKGRGGAAQTESPVTSAEDVEPAWRL